MTIYYSTNPTDWTQIDGIYVNEINPPASVTGVGSGVVGLVSKLDWGIENSPVPISSVQDLNTAFGYYSGLESQLTNLTFSSLYVVRASATGDVASSATLLTGAVLTAKYKGSGGNFIQYSIQNPTSATVTKFKLLIRMVWVAGIYSTTSVVETYDEVDFTSPAGITDFTNAVNNNSKYVTVGAITAVTRPVNIAYTNFAGGTSGSPLTADYTTALNTLNNSVFPDIVASDIGLIGTDPVNTALYNYAIGNNNKIAIITLNDNQTTALTEVIPYTEATGRIICVSGLVAKVDNYGRNVVMPTAVIMAATLSSTSPAIDPAYVSNASFFSGVISLSSTIPRQRSDYISLNAAGICAPEYDPLYAFKFKNGVTTQLVNADLRLIYTRRMTNYLERSIARYLVNFQNAPNTLDNRLAAKGAIISFIKLQQQFGLLPQGDNTYSVDVVTPNTPAVLAQNMFIINYKQQLISSMRFIVLSIQVGASVTIQS